MLKEFWEREKALLGFTGFIAALGALFLNVIPPNNDAKIELANIQVFWLLVLTLGLTILFARFVKLSFKKEKEAEKRSAFSTGGYLSYTAGIVFLWIVLNFWGYMFSSYPGPMTVLIFMTSGAVLIGAITGIEYAVHEHIEKFSLFSEFMIESFGFAALVSYVVILAEGFFFKGYGLKYSGLVGVIAFILIFLLGLSLSMRRGRKIFTSRAFQDMTIK